MMTEAEFTARLIASQEMLMRVAMKYSRKRCDAKDLVQDTLLKGWEHRHRFLANPRQNVDAWLITILRNRFHSLHRRIVNPNVQFVSSGDVDSEWEIFAAPDNAESRVELIETVRALAHLPRPQQDAVVCAAIGMSYERAAKLTGSPIGTAKTRLHRARHALMVAA